MKRWLVLIVFLLLILLAFHFGWLRVREAGGGQYVELFIHQAG